jgi:hypothetical protein
MGAPGLFTKLDSDCALVVSQAATLKFNARRSNSIKVFIVFILNPLLWFDFSGIDDTEFTGINSGKILHFSPIGLTYPSPRKTTPWPIAVRRGAVDSLKHHSGISVSG